MKPPLNEFSLQDLQKEAPHLTEREITSTQPEAKAFVHCECALAVEMKYITQEKLEIGVSKGSCCSCINFLEEFASQFGPIVVSEDSGKVYRDWLCPANVSQDIYKYLEKRAREDFSGWLTWLNRKRTQNESAGNSKCEREEARFHVKNARKLITMQNEM